MNYPGPEEYFRRIHRIMQLLDERNIRIIDAMTKHGPRNLQLIARELEMPYPTLYSRVSRLEQEGVLCARGSPDFSRIGLSRALVQVSPMPGKDLLAREALMIPNYWLKLMRCMGDRNGYYSIHAVPTLHAREFEEYIDHLVPLGIIAANYKMHWLENQQSFNPNFEYYDSQMKKWRFDWTEWLKTLSKSSSPMIESSRDNPSSGIPRTPFDTRDLYVMKELSKDATVKLADFARMFHITLPAAKYRFDNVMKKGLIREWVFDILPYAPEISDLLEVRMDFRNQNVQNDISRQLATLPFVLFTTRLKGLTSSVVRVYLPRGEMNNLITMLTVLVQKQVLTNFTYVWLDSTSMKSQTFSYEKYVDGVGWDYDNSEYNDKLQELISALEDGTLEVPSFEPKSIVTLH